MISGGRPPRSDPQTAPEHLTLAIISDSEYEFRPHHQEQRARDLIDGGRGEVDLAHRHPERPLLERHRGDQEGDSK